MKQKIKDGDKWFVVLFSIAMLLLAVIHAPDIHQLTNTCDINQPTPTEDFTIDAIYGYIPQIAGKEPVDNWHSALFMYEGKAMIDLSANLFNVAMQPSIVLVVAWFVNVVVLIFNFSLWLHWLTKTDRRFYFIVLPFVSIIVYLVSQPITLDTYFYAPYATLLTICCILAKCSNKKHILLCISILLIVLLHMIEFRKNSAILLPIPLYIIASKITKNIGAKIAVALIGSLVLFLVLSRTVCFFLPVQERFPLTPMMESDMRIAAILENKQANLRSDFAGMGYAKSGDIPLYNSLTASVGADRYSGKNIDLNKWNEYYINLWKSNTPTMLYSKFIQVAEFYCGGILPVPLQKLTSRIYPAIENNPDAMRFLVQTRKIFWIPRLLVLFATIIIPIYIATRNDGLIASLPINELLIALGMLFAAFYSLSYIIITPTSDARFLAPAVSMGVWSILAFFICWLRKKYERITNISKSADTLNTISIR